MDTVSSVLISLIRAAFGRGAATEVPADLDWTALLALSRYHGVPAVAMDGLLSSGITLPREQMREWMMAMVKVETAYEKGKKVIADLAEDYSKAGVPLMVIKGYGLSLDYPVPEHRPTGDIDIWNFGLQEKADAYLASSAGVKIDNGVHNHSVFSYKGMTVENHFDFLNVYAHRSNRDLNARLKEMASSPDRCVPSTSVGNLYFPSSEFNALYLLRHMAAHFAAEKVTFRHLLDWGTFVERHSGEFSWDDLLNTAKENNMDRFLACINGICISDFGFPKEAFPEMPVDQALKTRVFDDIMDARNGAPAPGLAHIGQRMRRWTANSWKHRIVYGESLAETFFSQVAAHLMKPASFKH